jgi:hypothetical protein
VVLIKVELFRDGFRNRKGGNPMFKWKKKGRIFAPNNNYPWMFSHAQCPFPLEFEKFIRVYFATREEYTGGGCRAYGGFVDLDKTFEVIDISTKPLMELGGVGEFDEFGSMPISVVRHGEFLLYYVGWSEGTVFPMTGKSAWPSSDGSDL